MESFKKYNTLPWNNDILVFKEDNLSYLPFVSFQSEQTRFIHNVPYNYICILIKEIQENLIKETNFLLCN